MADSIDTPEWKKFVADYKAQFKDGFPSPSLFAYLYYINTRAALEADHLQVRRALTQFVGDDAADHPEADEDDIHFR